MRSRSRWLLAIALVVLSAIALIVAIRLRRDRGPLSALWDAVPREARVLEGRIAQMPWAPYRGPLRGTADATSLKLMGLVGQTVEQAQTSTSVDAQHAAGVALLLIDRP